MLRPSRLRIDRPVYVFVLYHKAVLPGSAGTVFKKRKTADFPKRKSAAGLLGVPGLFAGKGQQGDVPGPLDRDGQLTLVPGAIAGHPLGQDLTAF